MRLNKFLASAGVASRRGADDLVRQGRVTVNGQVVQDLGRKVDPEKDAVKVDGRRALVEPRRYFIFHKPDGMVTTLDDPEERASIRDVVAGLPGRVVPVGRLDYHTEGLLLLTNDGELAQRLMHPRFQVARVYEAKVNGVMESATFERLGKGVRLEDGWASAEVKPLRRMEKNSYILVTVREGRKHLVRRLLAAVGHEVIRLTRVQFGPLVLGDVPPGQWRPLDAGEVARLRDWLEAKARRDAKRPGGAPEGPPKGRKGRFKNVNLRQRGGGSRGR
jgi:23S rRNA pseudouridine2605 synthase